MLRNKKGKQKKVRKGFTLVELIVVLAIIGVLSAIATPTILSKVDEARKQTDIANAASIAMAVKSEMAANKVDKDKTTLDTSSIASYFDGEVPTCKSEKDAEFQIAIDNNNVTVKTTNYIYYPITKGEPKLITKEGTGDGSGSTPAQP